jgi:hypothetical protein
MRFTGLYFTHCSMPGSEFLEDQDIDHKTDWDLWSNFMALGLMTIGVGLLGYIQLRRMKKLK